MQVPAYRRERAAPLPEAVAADRGPQPIPLQHEPVDSAVHHDRNLVGHCAGNANVLLDDENVHLALGGECQQHLFDLRDDHRGQALGRLVHDEQARIGQKRPRDRQHLLLAARQLGTAVTLPLGKAREGRIDAFGTPRSALLLDHLEVLINGQRPPKPPSLGHITNSHARDFGSRPTSERLTGIAHRTGSNRHQAHDRLAERCLAHAVSTDNRKHARFQLQVHAL